MLAEWSPRTPFADGVASVVFTIIILTIPVLFIIYASRWACEDAEERGMSKIVSVILVVMFFPLGWVFWLIMRPKKKAFDFQLYKYEHSRGRTRNEKNNES